MEKINFENTYPLRCAVFTKVDYTNYGNRLLCFATCKIFAALGVNAEIMIVDNEDTRLTFFAKLKHNIKLALQYRFDRMLVKIFLSFKKHLIRSIVKKVNRRIIKLRRERFIAFSSEHIAERDYGLRKFYFLPSFSSQFDFFAVGGDQVWNPFFSCTDDPRAIYFLPFMEKDKRAFMFSTSFGVSEDVFFGKIAKTPGLENAYRDALSRMAYISCREDTGAEIVKRLGGKARVLIDPTMTLPREEWLSIAKIPPFLSERLNGKDGYALLFFLGKLPYSLKKKVTKFCADKNLAVIALNDLFDSSAYITDPAEFVYLLANARTVYTDSFHGAVFSIIFETVFFVFERAGFEINMLSRMNTLLRKFDLEDRLLRDLKNFHPEGRDFKMDFSKAREILSKEREKAILFLKTVFDEMENARAAAR